VKSHRPGRAEQEQGRGEDFQQAKAMEVQRRLLIQFILDQKKNLTTETRRHGENREEGSPEFMSYAQQIHSP